MQGLKDMLYKQVIFVLKDRELAEQYRLTPPNGMLLYGPPGCGKTFFAEKFAEETGLNFILIKASDLGSSFVHGSQSKISKLFKLEEDNKMSQEELLLLVEEVRQEGSIDESEGELLKNAIEFRDQVAEDILTHRTDLEAVSVDTDKEEVARVFTQSRFSRLLVYEENIDNRNCPCVAHRPRICCLVPAWP